MFRPFVWKKLHLLELLVVLGLVLSACATASTPEVVVTQAPGAEPTSVPAQPEPTQPPAAEPAGRKVAVFIFTQEFDTLNPLYTNMWFSSNTHQIFNAWAWDFDDQNEPRPVLVKEIPSTSNGGISADGRVITMQLRDDLVWSDGTPLTAKDFIFTYEMTIDPKNSVAAVSPYDLIETIEAPDERTVVITFTDPYAPWVGTLWHGIIPEHVLRPVFERDGTLDKADWNRAPTVGCGPFVFAEWESGSFARFVANENYWLGRPILDEIFIRFVPDDASQKAALVNGDGDLGTFFSYSDIEELEKASIEVLVVQSGYNEGWYFHLDPENSHPALQDVRVRQAIAYGFDRFALNNDLLLGLTKPASTYWDNTPYVDPSLQPYPYDVEKAKALLDEAGWVDSNGDGTRDKDGVELVLSYATTTREIRQDTQAVAQQELGAIGIKFDLVNYDSDIFFSGYGEGGPVAKGEHDLFQYSTSPSFPDPDSSDWLCSEIPSDEKPSGTNWSAICDEALDALFQKQATQVDFAARQATFHQITKYLFDNAYWVGLWQDPDLWGISPNLLNVKISGATPFFNIMEWDISP